MDKDGFIDINELLKHYDIPAIEKEERELITLKQGDILIFLAVYLTVAVLLMLWITCVCIYMHLSRSHL